MAAMCSESKPRTLRLLVSYMTLARLSSRVGGVGCWALPALLGAGRSLRGL